MPVDEKNRYGVGYVVEKKPIKVSGWADAALRWNNFALERRLRFSQTKGRSLDRERTIPVLGLI